MRHFEANDNPGAVKDVLDELEDRGLLDEVDEDLHTEIAEALIHRVLWAFNMINEDEESN